MDECAGQAFRAFSQQCHTRARPLPNLLSAPAFNAGLLGACPAAHGLPECRLASPLTRCTARARAGAAFAAATWRAALRLRPPSCCPGKPAGALRAGAALHARKRVHLFSHVLARRAARRPIFCVARAPLRSAQLTQPHQAADDAERRVGLRLRLCWQPRPACGRARQNPCQPRARLFHCCGRRAPARVRGPPRKKRRQEQEQTALTFCLLFSHLGMC